MLAELGIGSEIRTELRNALKLFSGIEDVRPESRLFHQVQLHQNNRLYSFLLNICRFFLESLQPDDKTGRHRFHDVARDQDRMRRVFEKFVRNSLARRFGPRFSVSRDFMPWTGHLSRRAAKSEWAVKASSGGASTAAFQAMPFIPFREDREAGHKRSHRTSSATR